MPKKETKKKWKEKKRRAQQAYQKQKALDAKRKPQKFPMQKLFVGVALIVLILTAYGIWQYYEGQKPPTIGGASGTVSPSTTSATDFSLRDINGTQVSLSQFSGRVIGIHFMAVGCGGQINPVNEYQLAQLENLCGNLCGKETAAILTVAVATCENSALDVLRSTYGVTWVLGNDYDDGALEIVNAYVPHEIGDGSVVLIDKDFNVAQVYRGGVAAETLSSKISQLLEV
jgi:cytochrome oxidase Cu insertion factor (SCO1/SenC/PrrC family)